MGARTETEAGSTDWLGGGQDMTTVKSADGSNVRVRVDFGAGISADLAPEIHKRMYYLSEEIVDFSLIVAGAEVVGVELLLRSGAAHAALADHVRTAIDGDLHGIKPFKPRRVWDNDGLLTDGSPGLFEELVRKKLIHVHGEGQVGITGELVSLFHCFDSLFRALSEGVFLAVPYRFPTLLRTGVLSDAGYFDKFPHFLMFVTRMRNDVKGFDEFKAMRNTLEEGEHRPDWQRFTCETGYNAPPTMCYYVYDMFRGRAFTNDMAVTTVGKSFRYENKYHHPLTRLWDFTIRETVFLGSERYVRASVEAYRRMTTALMESLGLRGTCETASDPFFLADQTSALINTQLLLGAKYELRLRVGPDETVAAASFNLHGQYFAKRFDLRDPTAEQKDGHIFTGCIGVGLERLLFAFLKQKGADSRSWPAMIRDGLDSNRKQLADLGRQLAGEIAQAHLSAASS